MCERDGGMMEVGTMVEERTGKGENRGASDE
jgi:hypothetical protein